MTTLQLGPDGHVRDSAGRLFDPRQHAWMSTDDRSPAAPVDPAAAVRAVVAAGGRRLPVGVIGPNDAGPHELDLAERVGAAIARDLTLPMICGGRGGCMEAASRGHAQAGGLVIGILPSSDPLSANPFVSVPVASGIGEARNAIIASACIALVAVGGGHGTLSEMALGLKMGRTVIAMPPAARVSGAVECDGVDAMVTAVARTYLGLAP